MEEKKYELTDETFKLGEHILHRIKSLKDFGDVKKGNIGGFIESEENLSQEGNCWIYNDAKVFEKSIVHGNALVFDDAMVCCNAKVYNNAKVYGNARVFGDAQIYNNAKVYDNAKVFGHVKIYDHAIVLGDAHIHNNAKVYGNAWIYGNARVFGDAEICGNAEVFGAAFIAGNPIIKDKKDYTVFKNTWSSGRYFTWTRSNDMWNVGCFYGTGKELIEKAYADSEESGKNYEKYVKFAETFK